MRTAIVGLVVVVIAGLSALAVDYKYFGAKAPGSPAPAPITQAVRAPEVAVFPSPSGLVFNDGDTVQTMSPDHDVAEKQRQIRASYEKARKISSTVERDKEYAILVGYATGAGDFELAIDIASRISAAGMRDNSYAEIVQQAMTIGDAAAADKAAEKISSVILRDEQFRKIAASCPSNTTTDATASVLGLKSENRAEPVQRSDRGRPARELR
jgi:hypothetical protein